MPKRPITTDDLFKINLLSDPQTSPDGRTIAFVQTIPDLANDKYHSHIWLVPADGSAPARQFTFGNGKDRAPRWSPDGNKIAFISDREEEKKERLYLIALEGGEAIAQTDVLNKPSAPVWSPDGTLIAFTAKVIAQETKAANGARDDSDVKSYTRLNYKFDGEGLWDYGWRQIFLTPLSSPPNEFHRERGKGAGGLEVRQLTRGNFNHLQPAWSPDGKTIVFAANRTPKADETNITDIWSVPAKGGALQRLTKSKGPAHAPAFSPDGKWIAFVGHENEFSRVTQSGIYVMAARGGKLRKITLRFDRDIGDSILSDLRAGEHEAPEPLWSRDGKTIYFSATSGGSSNILAVPANGGKPKQITQGDHQIYDYSFSSTANRFALAICDALNPNDLFVCTPTGNLKRVTNVNAAILNDLQLSKPERFVVPRDDGWKVEGWLMKPFGWKAGKKYPAVLEIHGGPHGTYGMAFFHEFQLLCAQGFAVVFTNPRGSAGYGQDFVKATYHDWGGGDYRDLMAAMDVALKKFKWINAKRCGVIGGSYGGFMTSWVVTHSNRFKAAVTTRALNNWHSFYGTSDIGSFFASEWEVGGEPWNNPAEYLAHSPIAHVKNCKTPTLIIHNEKDFRCPIEQAEQFYVSLKKLGVPTQLVRYPDESHNLSRNGKPKHRAERLERIVEWFKRWV